MSYYSRKAPGGTMGSYSGNSKYTETFFHHPTRNPHNELHYEMRMANRQIKTFHPKKKSSFQGLMYESSLNPLPSHQSHHEPNRIVTGDRKKVVPYASGKSTDPINLSYQGRKTDRTFVRPFQATASYTMDIERKHYLPIQREIGKPNRQYQHQLGFSATSRDHVESKPELNNSLKMKSTLNYESSKSMKKFTCFDDFKYNSRK